MRIQPAAILLPTFEAPSWVMKVFVFIIALGFVIEVFIAWAFEMTPEGRKWWENILPDDVIPQWSKRKFATLIICVALLAAGLLFFNYCAAGHQPTPRARAVSLSRCCHSKISAM